MHRPSRRAGAVSLLALTALLLAGATRDVSRVFHERKEVAGLAVVFGAEPEPALTDEMQFLRWRVTSLANDSAYSDLQDAEVVVHMEGREFGPFAVQHVRREPGLYQTRHIFTAPGEYESVLRFRKGEDQQVHSVDFTFRIGDRSELELPPRKPGGR